MATVSHDLRTPLNDIDMIEVAKISDNIEEIK
jgi:hypothetical protein